MAYLNKVFLIGNLTRDPELRTTPKGTAISAFGLAINRHSAPTLEQSRAIYQAGYITQRRGSFRTPNPYPLASWQAKAWDQGYDHAAYAERHGLQHLHLPNVADEQRRGKDSV